MPSVMYVPSRIGEGHFVDFQPPATGVTDNGKVWAWNSATSRFEPVTVSAGGTPGGSTTHVQYNNAGSLAGDSGFTYAGSGVATLTGRLNTSIVRAVTDGTAAILFQNAAGSSNVATFDTANLTVGIATAATSTARLTLVGVSNGIGLNVQSGWGTGALSIGADVNANTLTASVRKLARIVMPDYAASATGVLVFSGDVTGTDANNVYFGGTPGGSRYAATALRFVTAANGTTVGGTERVTITNNGYMGVGVSSSVTALLDLAASTTARASLRIRPGVAPTSPTPNAGDMWFDGTNLKFYDGAAVRTITWT